MQHNDHLLTYLRQRRTIVAPFLSAPGPTNEDIETLLTIAARVPDHGKLVPWRFILFQGKDVANKLDPQLLERYQELHPNLTQDDLAAYDKLKLSASPLVVGVISSPRDHPKIPEWEQVLSSGAVCMNLIHAAHGLGFCAHWVTRWYAFDETAKTILGIAPHEKVAGFIQIGTPTIAPDERTRPDIDDITTHWQATT